MTLSIVMITVPDREKEFEQIVDKVRGQISYCESVHPTLGGVQLVIVKTDKYNNGGPTIGAKRSVGLRKSTGKYVCWLDDDDDIAPDYVETILRLAQSDADVLTFNNISRFDSFWCVVQMSLHIAYDDQVEPGFVWRRPYHVCAFKRELIEDLQFPDANWDEDTGFIGEALKRCKTQARSNRILHEYKRITKSLAEETL